MLTTRYLVRAVLDLADRYRSDPIPAPEIEHLAANLTEVTNPSARDDADALPFPEPSEWVDGQLHVDVYAWIGVDEVAHGLRTLVRTAETYPNRAIYASDLVRLSADIEHAALRAAATDHHCSWQLLHPAYSEEPAS